MCRSCVLRLRDNAVHPDPDACSELVSGINHIHVWHSKARAMALRARTPTALATSVARCDVRDQATGSASAGDNASSEEINCQSNGGISRDAAPTPPLTKHMSSRSWHAIQCPARKMSALVGSVVGIILALLHCCRVHQLQIGRARTSKITGAPGARQNVMSSSA